MTSAEEKKDNRLPRDRLALEDGTCSKAKLVNCARVELLETGALK